MPANLKTASYDRAFYAAVKDGSLQSAAQILPVVLNAVPAQSALDVGCGIGTWLNAIQRLGVCDCMGIDGEYVEEAQLLIPSDRFVAMDLAKPTPLGRRFDLVMSLEVAEHLSPGDADNFVKFLTAHGDVVLFSAAAPYQGGTDHRNEQWPNYWAKKFSDLGYRAIDGIRSRFFSNSQIDWWYAQNALIYATDEALAKYPHLRAMPVFAPEEVPSLVHPMELERWVLNAHNALRQAKLGSLVTLMPAAIKRGVMRQLRRMTGP